MSPEHLCRLCFHSLLNPLPSPATDRTCVARYLFAGRSEGFLVGITGKLEDMLILGRAWASDYLMKSQRVSCILANMRKPRHRAVAYRPKDNNNGILVGQSTEA